MRPGPRARVAVALALIVLVGGALRADVAAAPAAGRPSGDEHAYAVLAFSLARGTYGDRAAGLRHPLHWPPGAPALFSLAARADPDPALPLAHWLQALAGTALIAVCFGIATLAAGAAAGLVAAALVAFYPPLITATGALLGEPLGALLLAGGVLALSWRVAARRAAALPRARRRPARGRRAHPHRPPDRPAAGRRGARRDAVAPRGGAARDRGRRHAAGRLRARARAVGRLRVAAARPARPGDRGRRAGAVRRHLPPRRRHDARDEAPAGGPGARALPVPARPARREHRRHVLRRAGGRAAAGAVAVARAAGRRAARTCAATRSGSRCRSPR